MNHKFKVGDLVMIVGKRCALRGHGGRIARITDNKTWPYEVNPDGPYDFSNYGEDELELVNSCRVTRYTQRRN